MTIWNYLILVSGITCAITDEDLLQAGVLCGNERQQILKAFSLYEKQKYITDGGITIVASAPVLPPEEASAPLPDNMRTICSSECVICLDIEVIIINDNLFQNITFSLQCQIIFVPCGHLCCCSQCSLTVSECPLCRTDIERKITAIT